MTQSVSHANSELRRIAFGEILTFSGSLIGIDYKYRYRE
jgi:hypothetical protein